MYLFVMSATLRFHDGHRVAHNARTWLHLIWKECLQFDNEKKKYLFGSNMFPTTYRHLSGESTKLLTSCNPSNWINRNMQNICVLTNSSND